MRLVSRFSCKLNIERNGSRLLGPKLQSALFSLTVQESNNTFQFTISPKSKNVQIPSSPYIPRRFTLANIHKVSTQCIPQGRMSITLVNYNSSAEGYKGVQIPAMLTVVYISEALPEALSDLFKNLKEGPGKRTAVEAIEDCMAKRKKVSESVWDGLSLELLSSIFEYTGESLGKFRLVSRKWMQFLGYLVKTIRIKNPNDAPGEVIIRAIKKNPYVENLKLSGCGNLQITHVKKAMGLPLKRVKVLDLSGCKKLNSEALFLILRDASKCQELNLINSSADDSFFINLNRNIHMTQIKKLSIGPNFTKESIRKLLEKYPSITSLNFMGAHIDTQLCYYLVKFPKLQELSIRYSNVENLKQRLPLSEAPLKKLIVFPMEKHPPPCDKTLSLLELFTKADLEELACVLRRPLLEKVVAQWSNLTTLTVCDTPPDCRVKSLSLYTDGHDLLQAFSFNPTYLSSLTRLALHLNSDLYMHQLKTLLTSNNPELKLAIYT